MSFSASPSRNNSKSKKTQKSRYNIPKLLLFLGYSFVILGVTLIALIYYPVIVVDLNYRFSNLSSTLYSPVEVSTQKQSLVPVDTGFGIVIPKIGASARIIPNVDPTSSLIYQNALSRGVAHALGTSFPGEPGNVFLFSHSSADFYLASRYNSVFYLINKLVEGDEIDIYYKNELYKYNVTGKKIVGSRDSTYLYGKSTQNKLTLMTCWPPGTTLKRLIVEAVAK